MRPLCTAICAKAAPYTDSRIVPKSYPRLTLDFHTNKRIIDEVVRVPPFFSALQR